MATQAVCAIEGCGKPALYRGWCNSHYLRWQRYGDPLKGGPARQRRASPTCVVEGCRRPNERGGRGMCPLHYRRAKVHGDPSLGAKPPRGLCSVPGCDRPHASKGLCVAHRTRLDRHGDVTRGGPVKSKAKKGDLLGWLRRHVAHEGADCLIWPFVRDTSGYGGVHYLGRDDRAHRVMCALAHGAPPNPKYEAAHSCGRGHDGCVNPKHLRWATRAENAADKIQHGTQQRGEDVWCARLNEDTVRWIRSNAERLSTADMARALGVHRVTVRNVIRRRTWAWLK